MTSNSTQPDTTDAATVSSKKRRRGASPYLWVWGGVILIYVLMAVLTPNQASLYGIATTLPYIGLLALVAVGQTLVVMQRGIDFSVVGALLVTGMVIGHLTGAGGWPLIPAILVTLAVGVLIGIINGVIVVYLKLTPLVATLAANGLYLGISLILSGGAPVRVSAELNDLARGDIFGVSTVLIIAVIVTALLVLFLGKTVAGRRFISVGSNPATAKVAGIATNRYVLMAYVIAGACYALAGILLAGHIGDSRMTNGGTYLMASIAAVVIGGTPLTGGRGSLVASFAGAIFMSLLAQMVVGFGAPKSVQLLVQAVVLVCAVALPSVLKLIQDSRAKRRFSQPIKVGTA
jgi:ribose transport system permease protein